jgi:hypothetical protein
MRSTGISAVARMYNDLATKAAAAAIDEELMFAAEKNSSQVQNCPSVKQIATFVNGQLTRVIQIAVIKSIGKLGIKVL